ncbi:hypothetical protein GCM10009646_17750 [Streptomyces aureus]
MDAPKERAADSGGLREAVEAAGEGVDGFDLHAEALGGSVGGEETVIAHSDHDIAKLFPVTANNGWEV